MASCIMTRHVAPCGSDKMEKWLTGAGNLRQRRPLWDGQRPFSQRCQHPCETTHNIHSKIELGDIGLLLRDACRAASHDSHAPTVPVRESARRCRHAMGIDCHAHSRRYFLPRFVRSALFPRFRREHHPHRLHVYSQRILYARGAINEAKLVVFVNRGLDCHRGCLELWFCTNYRWDFEAMAIHLSLCGGPHGSIWSHLLRYTQLGCDCMVPISRRAKSRSRKIKKRANWCPMPEDQVVANTRRIVRYQGLACGADDGWSVRPFKKAYSAPPDRHSYTVNGAVSGFGPLIVSTFGYSKILSFTWFPH